MARFTRSTLGVLHALRSTCSPSTAADSSRKACATSTASLTPKTHPDWLPRWAFRCRIPAFVALARTVRANRDRILAAIELGPSNSKLEGLNSRIRLINHRGYAPHTAA